MNGIKSLAEIFSDFLKYFFGETLRNIEVKDVIDILLLSLVLFFIYNLIRDSRAWKLIIGLMVMLAISVIAEVFEMSALGFIFGNFQQLGLIAILVLFQPEFRTALERVGGTPITGIKSIAANSEAMASVSAQIESVCTAAADLSRDKLGALMVIERSTKLGDFIRSGVEIDSVVSPFVLKNIFFNKAPLHDGAVILRNGRIAAAGCFLPLSTKEDIDKDLGTRHRAAIGLTEVSDAVVIIVSEETGKISLAVGGTLERNYNYATLKQALNSILVPQAVENVKNKISKSQKKKDD
jgi:diadenylate cyclase